MRCVTRLVLSVVGLLGALVLLHRAGDALPIDSSPAEPTLLLVAGLRYGALATGWYLLAATVIGGLGRLARLRPLVRTADRLTPRRLRRVLDTSLGLSMLATVAATPAAWAAPPTTDPEPPPATMLRLPDEPDGDDRDEADRAPTSTSTSSSSSTAPATPRVPVARGPSDRAPTTTTAPTTSTTAASSTTTTTSTLPAPAPAPVPPARPGPPPAAPASSGADWTVAPGDHFWSIATRVLAHAWTRPPTDAEVDAYWRTLVAANRDRLADRDNPDLLFVGQVLGLPPPPPAPP